MQRVARLVDIGQLHRVADDDLALVGLFRARDSTKITPAHMSASRGTPSGGPYQGGLTEAGKNGYPNQPGALARTVPHGSPGGTKDASQ